jgi:N-methylhydantoinase A
VRTCLTPLAPDRLGDIEHNIRELIARADAWFASEAVEERDQTIEVVLDARYVGQNFELAIRLATTNPIPPADRIRRQFLDEHERVYGFHNPGDPIEVVNFRLVAIGRLKQPGARPAQMRASGMARTTEHRLVWFSPDRAEDTPVYDRAMLRAGDTIDGPAVIEQLDSTTLLFSGDRARADSYLNLDLEIAS